MGVLASSVTFSTVLITPEKQTLELKAPFLTWLPQLRRLLWSLVPEWKGDWVKSNPFICCPLDMALFLDLKPFLNKSWCLGTFPTLWIYLTWHFRLYVVCSISIIHSILLVKHQPAIRWKLSEKFISTLDLTRYHPQRKHFTQRKDCLTWGSLIPNPFNSTGNSFSGQWGQCLTHPCCLSSHSPQRPINSSKLNDSEKHLAKKDWPWS